MSMQNDVPPSKTSPRIGLLGVPVDVGASQRGTLMGPAALRTAGLKGVLQALGLTIEDHGDLDITHGSRLDNLPPENAKNYHEIQAWIRAISVKAFAIAASGA